MCTTRYIVTQTHVELFMAPPFLSLRLFLSLVLGTQACTEDAFRWEGGARFAPGESSGYFRTTNGSVRWMAKRAGNEGEQPKSRPQAFVFGPGSAST